MNGTNESGQTALILAAVMGRLEIVPLLLDAGADARLQDRSGLTALEWSRRRGFWEVTQLLASASPPLSPTAPKSTSDSAHAEVEKEINRPIAPELQSEGLNVEELGPATKASLRATQVHRKPEAAAVAEPSEAQSGLDPQPGSPVEMVVATESEASALATGSEPATDTELLALPTGSEPTTQSEPPVSATVSQPKALPTALEDILGDSPAVSSASDVFWPEPQTHEPDRISVSLNRFEEEVRRKRADQTPTLASEATKAATPEPTSFEATSPAALAASDISEPTTQSQSVPVADEQVPAFQTPTGGLSSSPTSSGATQISNLKRCPKCNKVYENTLLLYCTRDTTRLIGIDNPQFDPAASHSSARPLVWLLIAVVLGGSAFATYRWNKYFFNEQAPSPVAATRVESSSPPEIRKPTPAIGGALAGLEVNIPEPEYPVAAQSAGISGPITVRIQVNKKGKVVSARSSSGDRRLRAAAVKAATQATFSPEKLAQVSPRGRVVSGSITYEFSSPPTGATGAATSSSPATSSPADALATGSTAEQSGITASTGTGDANLPTNVDPKAPVVGGPLVGAAINVPAAEYPSRARRAGIAGAITVTVRVNRAGKVISWRTSTGDSQLRAAALKAAKKATFSRDKLPGTGDVVGTITYNFTP